MGSDSHPSESGLDDIVDRAAVPSRRAPRKRGALFRWRFRAKSVLKRRAIQLSVGAGEGNRTLVFSLEGCCSTIELHPRRSFGPFLSDGRCGVFPHRRSRRQARFRSGLFIAIRRARVNRRRKRAGGASPIPRSALRSPRRWASLKVRQTVRRSRLAAEHLEAAWGRDDVAVDQRVVVEQRVHRIGRRRSRTFATLRGDAGEPVAATLASGVYPLAPIAASRRIVFGARFGRACLRDGRGGRGRRRRA